MTLVYIFPVPVWFEGVVTLVPRDAGGRAGVITPRDGSYRPFARHAARHAMMRVRFIEGPPQVAPGESAQVVLEVEDGNDDWHLTPGLEMELVELTSQSVGILTVSRVWPGSSRGLGGYLHPADDL